MTKLTELIALADAATQNTYAYGSNRCGCGDSICHNYHLNIAGSDGGIGEEDALFISAANPTTVKRMAELLVQCRDTLLHANRAVSQEHVGLITEEALAALNTFEETGK
jgi:hypothetical protein